MSSERVSSKPMKPVTAEKVVFINTASRIEKYLPYNKSSIDNKKLPKKTDILKNVRDVLDANVPLTKFYKSKASRAIEPFAGTEEYNNVKAELNSRGENEEFYENYKPGKVVTEILVPYAQVSKKVRIEEPEEFGARDREEEFKFLADAELQVIETEQDSEYLFGLADDFLDEYKKKGYTEEQQRVINEKLKLLPPTQAGRDKALEVLRTMKLLLVPDDDPFTSFPTIIEESNPETAENPPSTAVETLSENVAMTPDSTVPPDQEPVTSPEPMPVQQPLEASLSSGGSGPKPFKERYHPNSLQLYFGSSTYPEWDLELETSVQKLELTTKGTIMFMDDIIKQYGPKIFVSERKSETREELNELMQLQFTILRSLKKPFKGVSGQTATVKLADLIKIDRLANNGTSPPKSSGLVVNPITPLPVSSSSSEIVTSRSEDAFIKNYDNYIMQQNLNIARGNMVQQYGFVDPLTHPKIQRVEYGQDPRNIQIVPGNNLISIKRDQGRRV